MAKISIHIPDEVLDKVRQHKDKLNISKVCSNALLKEVEVISNVPPMVEETRKLIERLRKDLHQQHLESFNLAIEAAHGLPVTASDLWLPLLYGAGYVAILLVSSVALFERRDFR